MPVEIAHQARDTFATCLPQVITDQDLCLPLRDRGFHSPIIRDVFGFWEVFCSLQTMSKCPQIELGEGLS